MTDYSSLSAEPKQFHALTGYISGGVWRVVTGIRRSVRNSDTHYHTGGQTPAATLCQLSQLSLAYASQ